MPNPESATKTPHAIALVDHVETYLADDSSIALYGLTGTVRAAIEHGWHGATADIAERMQSIVDANIDSGLAFVGFADLLEELKREVGA